ncbi:MAG TPA: heavy-metal-associated domain-containing protein [Chloroflexota bacterium]|nr:heavy-metal-associated domain-containing protein [Chloroflexota bacterium]
MALATLNVPDISCNHCERAIKNALGSIEGIQDVVVDIPAKQVQVAYDPERINLEQVQQILHDDDYPVESVA